MASVTSQLMEKITAYVQSNSLEDARKICADGTSLPNKQIIWHIKTEMRYKIFQVAEDSNVVSTEHQIITRTTRD